MLGLALVAFAQAASPPPLHGGPQMVTCPIGGERFEALATSHFSTMGSRPDGRPHTYWYMPLPIPECPSNGLVLFRDFTPEEIELLRPLILSEAYRAMVGRDSSYYRAQWLATRIGRPETESLGLLLRATWQVKPATGPTGQALPSPQLARRYQEEFIARVRALPRQTESAEFLGYHARAANAARELGRFEEAAAMLEQLRTWTSGSDAHGWGRFAAELAPVVARRDPAVEPLDLAQEAQQPWLCLDEARPKSDFDRRFCGTPEMEDRIAEVRRLRERAQRDRESPSQP